MPAALPASRAARWDGWIINCDDEQGTMTVPPARIAADTAAVTALRAAGDSGRFDIAVTGVSAGPGDPVADAYAQAGVTWWLEHIHGRRGTHASMLARISAGPPGTHRPAARPAHGCTSDL